MTQQLSRTVVRMSHRRILRTLSARNRRAWAQQRATLTPRVAIGSHWSRSIVFQSPYAYPVSVFRPRHSRVAGFLFRLFTHH